MHFLIHELIHSLFKLQDIIITDALTCKKNFKVVGGRGEAHFKYIM